MGVLFTSKKLSKKFRCSISSQGKEHSLKLMRIETESVFQYYEKILPLPFLHQQVPVFQEMVC